MKLSERVEAAREALDSLDDCARMDVGVDAHGPRGVLERFIADAEALARRVEGAGIVEAISLMHYADGTGVLDFDGEASVDVGQRVALVPVEGGA